MWRRSCFHIQVFFWDQISDHGFGGNHCYFDGHGDNKDDPDVGDNHGCHINHNVDISFTSQLLPPLPPGPLVVIVCGGNLVTLDLVQVPDTILTWVLPLHKTLSLPPLLKILLAELIFGATCGRVKFLSAV